MVVSKQRVAVAIRKSRKKDGLMLTQVKPIAVKTLNMAMICPHFSEPIFFTCDRMSYKHTITTMFIF